MSLTAGFVRIMSTLEHVIGADDFNNLFFWSVSHRSSSSRPPSCCSPKVTSHLFDDQIYVSSKEIVTQRLILSKSLTFNESHASSV